MSATSIARAWSAGVRPDPVLDIPTWADRYRELSTKESPEPGRWRTDRVPYLREIMQCLSVTSPVERVVLMKGSQVGGSEVGINWVGYVIHHAPGPMLIVQPTLNMMQRFSRQRIGTMIESTPVLRSRVPPPRSQEGGNKLDTKEFPGGLLIMATAGSAIELASMPVRYLSLEEVDRFEPDVDGEGDPVSISEQRTANYRSRRKIYLNSTPRRPFALSIIAAEYAASDRRRFWVPCLLCGGAQVLEWARVEYPAGQPERAVLVCEHCSREITDARRIRALQEGEWRAEAEFRGTAGFHLSRLYSPWTRIAELARKWEAAQRKPERLKAFYNLQLGITYEQEGEEVDPESLISRVETYPPSPLPDAVVLVTAGVDIQGDRFELEYVGWGRGEETWSLDYIVHPGDPSTDEFWRELDGRLAVTFEHPLGEHLRVAAACIDSGGHHTKRVYDFCRSRWARRIWAIKGFAGEGRPIISQPGRGKPWRAMGVDSAKVRIAARLQLQEPGPGYCHFPDRYDQQYFAGLTAEKLVTRFVRGYPRREWVKDAERRNEPLDCRVYAMGAFEALAPNLEITAQQLQERAAERRKAEGDPPRPSPPSPSPRRGGGGWVSGWKR